VTDSATLPIPAEELATLRACYPAGFESSLVMPCLRRIQELRGHVDDADIEALASYLRVPRVQIEEVLSFYTQYRREAERSVERSQVPPRMRSVVRSYFDRINPDAAKKP